MEPTIGSGWGGAQASEYSADHSPASLLQKKQIRRDGRFPDQIKQSFFPGERSSGKLRKRVPQTWKWYALSSFNVRDSISVFFPLTVGDFSPPSWGPFFNS